MIADIKAELQNLEDEERRYAKALDGGLMSEEIYKEQMQGVIQQRSELESKL